MATMYIWWHRAPAIGTYGEQNLVDEPYVGKTSVTTSSSAAASGAAPDEASVARVFSDTLTYYYVQRDGDSTAATTTDGRIEASTQQDISVKPGDTISLITD